MPSLETPPPAAARQRERRWALVSYAIGACVLVMAALAVNHLRHREPPPALAVDHGPLPEGVRAQVMAILDAHLLNARLLELHQGPVREFHIQGSSRAPLAQEFYAGFRPVVVNRLMPLLRPYGEIISFEITALDLPPARLRPIPKD
jgi:hypothetical protein